jgi:hypothetical protein
VAVWRSVRAHGETKTERSRRTLGLPATAVQALRAWAASQADEQFAAGRGWQDTGLVFTNHVGAALDAGNVRKMFKRICTEAGAGDNWTPRELRTTFVSLMSHQGVAIEESPAWSATPPPAPPRSSTAANYAPSSPPAPKSWTSSSPEPNPRGTGDTADQGAWRTEICSPICSTGPADTARRSRRDRIWILRLTDASDRGLSGVPAALQPNTRRWISRR